MPEEAKKNQPVEAVEKVPEVLPVSPMTIVCPYCGAKPELACSTASGGTLEVVHVTRLKAATALDRG